MPTGNVISYDPGKGEGMIQPDDENDKIPFDADSLIDPALKDQLQEGDHVRFGVQGGMAGLICTDVERIDA